MLHSLLILFFERSQGVTMRFLYFFSSIHFIATATLMAMQPLLAEGFSLSKTMQKVPGAYNSMLTEHHLLTECVTAGCMAGIGDYMAQRQSKQPWSPRRSMNFILKGLGEGVIWSFWYHSADVWINQAIQAALNAGMAPRWTALYRTLVALVMDFSLACPLIYGLWDIPLPALLSGVPLRDIPKRIRHKLGSMMLASIKLWTPINILIYNSPLKYRVLLQSGADVFWQSIVSAIATQEIATLSEADKELELGEPLLKNGVGKVNGADDPRQSNQTRIRSHRSLKLRDATA